MYHGIINIYKEKGFTSHDVVAKLRGILKQKKIGHTGTLDPDAIGVLPVCLGKATKLCDMLTEKEKTYVAELILGKSTDTQDISGKVINEIDIEERKSTITDDVITNEIKSFEGEYNQIPPMYSAIKINGKKLYELAREGIEIERKARKVNFYSINILSISYPYIKLEVSCSKGTYIRTLCHDIGIKLGTYACMTELERIKSGTFIKEHSLTLKQVEELVNSNKFEEHIIAIEKMFLEYDKIIIPEKLNKLLYNGNTLPIEEIGINQQINKMNKEIRVYDCNEEFIGIYQIKEEEQLLKPVKLFQV